MKRAISGYTTRQLTVVAVVQIVVLLGLIAAAASGRSGSGTSAFSQPKVAVQKAVSQAKTFAATPKGQATVQKVKTAVANHQAKRRATGFSSSRRPHYHQSCGIDGCGFYPDNGYGPGQSRHHYLRAFLLTLLFVVVIGVAVGVVLIRKRKGR